MLFASWKLVAIAACALLCTMCGGCYACAMFGHALTNVSSSEHDMSGKPDLVLKADGFLMFRHGDVVVVRANGGWGVPRGIEAYRRCAFWYDSVIDVLPKGTRLKPSRREFHNVGYVYWEVDHVRIAAGRYAGREVRLEDPTKVTYLDFWTTLEQDPNPDWLEYAPSDARGEP